MTPKGTPSSALPSKLPKKRGPRPKPPHDRTPRPPPQRPQQSRTREHKLQVIVWIMDPRNWIEDSNSSVRVREGTQKKGLWRPPTNREAAERWGVPPNTIGGWWKDRERILRQASGSKRRAKGMAVKGTETEMENRIAAETTRTPDDGRSAPAIATEVAEASVEERADDLNAT